MNPIVVTVGPDHRLREAAKRMTEHSVGAAVVMDTEGSGPGIITERATCCERTGPART